jgi:nucleotide-binding universal stress UspA family protein
MEHTILHVFRNTPFGRETFMHSLYFSKKAKVSILVYIPEHTKFLMYYDNDVVQVDLDISYLRDHDTAKKHAQELIDETNARARFIQPNNYTASTLPDIPADYDYMCCPRSVSDLSTKISLGHIGPKVRRIINSARFPVLIPSSLFKEWKSIIVFFGGSVNAVKALKLGLRLSKLTDLPLDIFTHSKKESKEYFEKIINERGLEKEVAENLRDWYFIKKVDFKDNLYSVPHDALVVLGAYGHGVVKDLLFGSTMELIQSTLTNTILIAGPNYSAPRY